MKNRKLFILMTVPVTWSITAQDNFENIQKDTLSAYGESATTRTDEFVPIIEKLDTQYQNDKTNLRTYQELLISLHSFCGKE